ncbi:MAG: 30S ribosomal protein S9 [archaeon]
MSEKKKKIKKAKQKTVTSKSKNKTSKARAVVTKGKGKVLINSIPLDIFQPDYVKKFIAEPIKMFKETTDGLDIKVNVKGGGFMSQAVAVRSAIAKGIINFTEKPEIKKVFMEYDKMLLVDDPRRKEAKKPLGKGARKKKQASKR